MTTYRRHRFAYSFRAWVDGRGNNCDRNHAEFCLRRPRCSHLRLWDLNTNRMSWNILRIVRRRRPFALGVYVGKQSRVLVNVGLER